MAANGCNFCGKVGIQPISNEQTTFNYDCLEVKNKKSNKTENQKKTEKCQSSENCKVTYLHEINDNSDKNSHWHDWSLFWVTSTEAQPRQQTFDRRKLPRLDDEADGEKRLTFEQNRFIFNYPVYLKVQSTLRTTTTLGTPTLWLLWTGGLCSGVEFIVKIEILL